MGKKGVAKIRHEWYHKCWGRMIFQTFDTLTFRRLVHLQRTTSNRGWTRRGIRNEMVDSPNPVERRPLPLVD